MQVLISDANILIDMEAGQLLRTLFQLPMRFAMPDVLYYEEVEAGSPGLTVLGLELLEVRGEFVRYAGQLVLRDEQNYPFKRGVRPSHNDYLALALAKQESCVLLTGDANLRAVAQREQVTVMGTIAMLCSMVTHQLLTIEQALDALELMKQRKRRLPWEEAQRRLKVMRPPPPDSKNKLCEPVFAIAA